MMAEKQSRIVAISVSEVKGTAKSNVGSARLVEGWGIEGDAHAGEWHRQVSLLSQESIRTIRDMGLDVVPGSFAENITVGGIRVHSLPVGTCLKLGECELEITQVGKECHSRCAIYEQAGDCVMPREGVFARVVKGGQIQVGDVIEVLEHSSE